MSTPIINDDIVNVEFQDDTTSGFIPSRTWEVTETQILGYIDGLDAMRQFVEHILMTEYNEKPILTDYGFERNQFIGERRSYIIGVYRTFVEEALARDDRFVRVENIDVRDGEQNNSLVFTFSVVTTMGVIDIESIEQIDAGF